MRLVSAQNGRLITVDESPWTDAARPAVTGLAALDQLLPPTGLACGAVHELLHRPDHPMPVFFALLLARMTKPEIRIKPETPNSKPRTPLRHSTIGLDSDFGFRHSSFPLVWIDPAGKLYPPAVFAAGIEPNDLWLLRPRDDDDLFWSVAECMRCRGVAATVAPLPGRIDRRDARRLQLAVERGGGAGIVIRTLDRNADIYAAATRWLVEPAPGARSIQRWKITLIHGHGGQIGSWFLLEHCRDPFDPNDPVRATAELADRPRIAATG